MDVQPNSGITEKEIIEVEQIMEAFRPSRLPLPRMFQGKRIDNLKKILFDKKFHELLLRYWDHYGDSREFYGEKKSSPVLCVFSMLRDANDILEQGDLLNDYEKATAEEIVKHYGILHLMEKNHSG